MKRYGVKTGEVSGTGDKADKRPPNPAATDFKAPYDELAARALSREVAAVAIILILSLGLRLFYTWQVYRSPFDKVAQSYLRAGTDMEKHLYIARWVLEHGWYEKSADVSPLYPYVVLPSLLAVTGDSILGTLILQGLIDTATVLLIYLLARRLYGRRPAVYASLGACVYAPFIVYQGQFLGESLLNLLVALFFVIVLGVRGKLTVRRALAAGAALGLAAAAKPTAVVFAPLAVIWLWKQSRLGLRGAAGMAAPMAAGAAAFLVVLLPFAWRNYRAVGEFHLVRGNSGIMLYMGNNPSATGAFHYPSDEAGLALDEETRAMPLAEKDRAYLRAALSFMKRRPREFAGLLARKFGLFFGAKEIPNNLSVKLYRQTTILNFWIFVSFGVVLPAALAGFALSIRRRGVSFVAAQAAAYSAAIILFVVVGRYRLAIVPLILPAAGFAAAELVGAFKQLAPGRFAAIAGIISAVALPVNREDAQTWVVQRLHPDGFVSRIDGNDFIHDDSAYETRYSSPLVYMYPDSSVTKFLIVKQPLDEVTRVFVHAQMAVREGGSLSVRLNDEVREIEVAPGPKRWLHVEFPVGAVRSAANGGSGSNLIELTGDDLLNSLVYADDVYHFGRSIYSPEGRVFLDDMLDQVSYARSPVLHMGGREFKIQLELRRPPAEE